MKKRNIHVDYARWIFVLPALLSVGLLLIYPIFSSLYYSMTTKHLIRLTYDFVGLENYKAVLSDSNFYKAFFNSLLWTAGSLLGQLAVGFTAALAINRIKAGKGGYRTLMIIPWAFPSIVATPNYLHKEPVIKTAEHGVHVFCEKPIAFSYSDCDEMVRACNEFFPGRPSCKGTDQQGRHRKSPLLPFRAERLGGTAAGYLLEEDPGKIRRASVPSHPRSDSLSLSQITEISGSIHILSFAFRLTAKWRHGYTIGRTYRRSARSFP